MKKYLKFIIIFVAIISFIILILNSKKTYSIETTIEEQRNAILATANAYYIKENTSNTIHLEYNIIFLLNRQQNNIRFLQYVINLFFKFIIKH